MWMNSVYNEWIYIFPLHDQKKNISYLQEVKSELVFICY